MGLKRGRARVIEGSRAIAEAVAACRPGIVCAYPITPQTHIVSELAEMVARGELDAEFVNAESEHSAASIVLGGVAAGVRSYTATSSQGLLLMTEVLYNIAGLRMPVVMTVANRSVSAPINIWNDHQDSYTVRDSGWIQLYAESNQEAVDLHIQAFSIAEDPRVLLPVMVCVDGYLLTHSYEPVEVPTASEVDTFLAPYRPARRLDPANPITMGMLAGPDWYMETRYHLHQDLVASQDVIEQVARAYRKRWAKDGHALFENFFSSDADTIMVAMGSVCSTIKDVVETGRNRGDRWGLVRLICHRPFPGERLRTALMGARHVIVLEKGFSPGLGGTLANEIRSLFAGHSDAPTIYSVVAGLGGRDITPDSIERLFKGAGSLSPLTFLDIRRHL
ncbi:MAG: pyruvate ferredoxin oxidoreductase [bacterium JZ-2024 1]